MDFYKSYSNDAFSDRYENFILMNQKVEVHGGHGSIKYTLNSTIRAFTTPGRHAILTTEVFFIHLVTDCMSIEFVLF